MKSFLYLFVLILIISGCQNKDSLSLPTKSYPNYNNFDYTKEQVSLFEKEYENILQIENQEILELYTKFYEKNSSFFLNGTEKVKNLQKKLTRLQKTGEKSDLLQLEKAKKVERDESIKIYKTLAKKGNIKAQRELVEIYKISNPTISLNYLEKLVDNQDIKSMKDYASSNIYMIRPIIVQDLEKAIQTYEKLAKLGELSSLMRLGNFYEYGYHKQIIKKDKNKSLEYYEMAASKDYQIAQKKLYEIYSCEKCKPNRYNPKRAKELKIKLLSNDKIIKEK